MVSIKTHTAQLYPFDGRKEAPFSLKVTLQRLEHSLSVRYQLLGDLQELSLPSREDSAVRKRGLWKESCFELFLTACDSKEYWEWNLASDGCWNMFRFSDYRENLREADIRAPHMDTTFEESCFSLNVFLELPEELSDLTLLRAGVSCVLKDQAGKQSFWSLSHPGIKPDFHDRRGFVLTL